MQNRALLNQNGESALYLVRRGGSHESTFSIAMLESSLRFAW